MFRSVMDDRRMLLLSILYQLVRWLLGLTAVLVRQDLSKDAELLILRQKNTVLRRQLARVRYPPTDRMWLAALSRLLPRRRWAEVFPDPSGHDPGLASQAARQDAGLPRTPPARTSPNHSGDQEAHRPPGDREPELGTPARAGRTGPPRPPSRRLHRVADPARGRDRSRTPPVGPDLAPVPHHPGPGRPGRGLRGRGHRDAATDLRVDHGRARLPPGSSARRDRAPDQVVDHSSRPHPAQGTSPTAPPRSRFCSGTGILSSPKRSMRSSPQTASES